MCAPAFLKKTQNILNVLQVVQDSYAICQYQIKCDYICTSYSETTNLFFLIFHKLLDFAQLEIATPETDMMQSGRAKTHYCWTQCDFTVLLQKFLAHKQSLMNTDTSLWRAHKPVNSQV